MIRALTVSTPPLSSSRCDQRVGAVLGDRGLRMLSEDADVTATVDIFVK